jgi:hypothetical protein
LGAELVAQEVGVGRGCVVGRSTAHAVIAAATVGSAVLSWFGPVEAVTPCSDRQLR